MLGWSARFRHSNGCSAAPTHVCESGIHWSRRSPSRHRQRQRGKAKGTWTGRLPTSTVPSNSTRDPFGHGRTAALHSRSEGTAEAIDSVQQAYRFCDQPVARSEIVEMLRQLGGSVP